MLKKTITYEDYNGDSITEDFYFNLSRAELIEMEVSEKDGFADTLRAIVKAGDGKEIIGHFKKLILAAYGQKSADGKRFIKTQELRDEFEQSEAYSELFMELATDAQAAADFMNAVVPAGIQPQLESQEPLSNQTPTVETTEAPVLSEEKDERPLWMKENRRPTQAELMNMPREELLVAMQMKGKDEA